MSFNGNTQSFKWWNIDKMTILCKFSATKGSSSIRTSRIKDLKLSECPKAKNYFTCKLNVLSAIDQTVAMS